MPFVVRLHIYKYLNYLKFDVCNYQNNVTLL